MWRMWFVAAVLLSLTCNLAAQEDGVLKKLDEGVYHYWAGYYSSLVVVTGEGVLITDPANPYRAAAMKKDIAKITSQPVKQIVLTHEHYDHVGGTEVFEGAKIICHDNCKDIFALDILGLAPKKVDVSFQDKLSISLGGKTIELHYFGPGDGVATTVVYMPQEQVVVTSDMYEPRQLTAKDAMDDVNYLGVHRIFNNIASWKLKHAINGHSPGTDPKDFLENVEFVNDLYNAVNAEFQKAIAEKGPAGILDAALEMDKVVTLPKYKDWKAYEDLPAHVRRMAFAIFHGG